MSSNLKVNATNETSHIINVHGRKVSMIFLCKLTYFLFTEMMLRKNRDRRSN